MRVEQDVKLTFNDVLIRPKRSTLVSRSDVNLEREFSFRHSDEKWWWYTNSFGKYGYYWFIFSCKGLTKI